jgi:hypothetical protein
MTQNEKSQTKTHITNKQQHIQQSTTIPPTLKDHIVLNVKMGDEHTKTYQEQQSSTKHMNKHKQVEIKLKHNITKHKN